MEIFTICKSSTDEYINSSCNHAKGVDEKFVVDHIEDAQIKAQEMDLNYPCLVSNIGLSRVMIQSITNPNQVNSFKIDDEGMEMDFLCFVDYQSLNDIGFKDTRAQAQADVVPFSETGDKIAFITRMFQKDDLSEGS